jgi:hypothetical protein
VMERGEHTRTHLQGDWVEEDGIPVLVPPEKEGS